MIIVPDINLLVYAYNADSEFHLPALEWWKTCVSESQQIGLLELVIFGFIRLSGNRNLFPATRTPDWALKVARGWLKLPNVTILYGNLNAIERTISRLEEKQFSSKAVTDTQIAEITIKHEGVLHTNDRDFKNFQGLKWFNPITKESNFSEF